LNVEFLSTFQKSIGDFRKLVDGPLLEVPASSTNLPRNFGAQICVTLNLKRAKEGHADESCYTRVHSEASACTYECYIEACKLT
jgi:hypothetical protein